MNGYNLTKESQKKRMYDILSMFFPEKAGANNREISLEVMLPTLEDKRTKIDFFVRVVPSVER